MSKFYDIVGFSKVEETSDGVYYPSVIEKFYKGDVLKDYRRWVSGTDVNPSPSLSNTISIISDQFSYENCYAIKYVRYLGVYWEVTGIEIDIPRLKLTLGGVYNGPKARSSQDFG